MKTQRVIKETFILRNYHLIICNFLIICKVLCNGYEIQFILFYEKYNDVVFRAYKNYLWEKSTINFIQYN